VGDETVTTVDTTADDALGTDDATGLLGRLARHEVSAGELRDAAVARARAANEHLNAVTCWVDEFSVGAAAVAADAPLAGIPTLVKDNEDLAGYRGQVLALGLAVPPARGVTDRQDDPAGVRSHGEH